MSENLEAADFASSAIPCSIKKKTILFAHKIFVTAEKFVYFCFFINELDGCFFLYLNKYYCFPKEPKLYRVGRSAKGLSSTEPRYRYWDHQQQRPSAKNMIISTTITASSTFMWSLQSSMYMDPTAAHLPAGHLTGGRRPPSYSLLTHMNSIGQYRIYSICWFFEYFQHVRSRGIAALIVP